MPELEQADDAQDFILKSIDEAIKKFYLKDGTVAYILLRLGLNYYLRDICGRGSDGETFIK